MPGRIGGSGRGSRRRGLAEEEEEAKPQRHRGSSEADRRERGSVELGGSGTAESREGSSGGAGEATEAIRADEGPEPARIPTSLTATLREQGGRYPHRVSRRSRRRGRDGRGPSGRGRTVAIPRRTRKRGRSRMRRWKRRPAAGSAHASKAARRERAGARRTRERPNGRSVPSGPSGPERTERPRAPSITDLLKEGQEIIVQIAKEPLGQKGARITSHIALPGRFVVYMPTVEHIGVSRKIPSDEERLRLKRILQTHRAGHSRRLHLPHRRPRAAPKKRCARDMQFLYNLWLDMRQKAEKQPAPAAAASRSRSWCSASCATS